jgi:hypothetical protein
MYREETYYWKSKLEKWSTMTTNERLSVVNDRVTLFLSSPATTKTMAAYILPRNEDISLQLMLRTLSQAPSRKFIKPGRTFLELALLCILLCEKPTPSTRKSI